MNNEDTDKRSETSSEELDEQVKLAELEKLRAETASIVKPFLQPATWIPILIGAGGIIAAIAQWQVSSIKQEKAALEAERRTLEAQKELEQKQQETDEFHRKLEKTLSQLDESRAKQQALKVTSDKLTEEMANKKNDIVSLEGKLQTLEENIYDLEKKRQKKADILKQLETRLAMQKNQNTEELIAQSRELEQEISNNIAKIKSDISLPQDFNNPRYWSEGDICTKFRKYDRKSWRRDFLRPTEYGTWHVFVASLAQNETKDKARKQVEDFQQRFPQLDFNLLATVDGSKENFRYAVVLAEGLPTRVLAQAISKYARKCDISSDAYFRQQ